ncbi:MAG: hypothetical protein AB8I08_12690 [Sandaracinaceae bacterium]
MNSLQRALLVSLLLLGCGGEETASASDPSAETASEEAAEAAAEAPPADPEAPSLTCAGYVDHMVEVLSVQGDRAFINASNRDEWVGACEGADNLQDPEIEPIASCALAAPTIEAVQECGDTRFMNRWFTRN